MFMFVLWNMAYGEDKSVTHTHTQISAIDLFNKCLIKAQMKWTLDNRENTYTERIT